jgi:hypothetical protein
MRIESSVSMMHKLQKWWEELLYAFKITCRLMLLDVFRMHWESCVIRDLGECKSSYNALLFFLTLLWMSRAYCDLAMETRQFWLSGSQLGGDGMHDCITVPISLVAGSTLFREETFYFISSSSFEDQRNLKPSGASHRSRRYLKTRVEAERLRITSLYIFSFNCAPW